MMNCKFIYSAMLPLATGCCAMPAASEAGAVFVDPLSSPASVTGSRRTVRGGKFIPGKGWQATERNSQIMLELLPPYAPISRRGEFSIDVTNFDPASQKVSKKQEIINFYSQPNGSKKIFGSGGSWWNIRTGRNYHSGFKFLSQPNSKRTESRLIPRATWDRSRTYTFRVVWDASRIEVYLDKKKLKSHPHAALKEGYKYIFIGTNNVYAAQPDVIYSNLRVINSDPGARGPSAAPRRRKATSKSPAGR